MGLGVEWSSAGIGGALVAAASSYLILKARLGHDQRINAEGALISSGPAIIAQLNVALADRDKRISALEQNLNASWHASQECEGRCNELGRRLNEALARIANLEREQGRGMEGG